MYQSVTELIGNTALLDLSSYINQGDLNLRFLAKAEFLNPSGSIKDRAAWAMIQDAISQGKVDKETVIIEPTSGNTGIALAMIAATLGNKIILTMPDNMSEERRTLLAAYGAELVMTPQIAGMSGAIKKAEALVKELPKTFMPAQFDNPLNALIHYQTTGPELWEDSGKSIDVFIAGVGTGGTISGTAKYLKEQNPEIIVIAVEPQASPVLSGGKAGVHNIQGIGAGFVPKILDTTIYDEIVTVSDEHAIATAIDFAKKRGISVGISSGAVLWAAKKVACHHLGKTVTTILPDSGNRYLSIFSQRNNL